MNVTELTRAMTELRDLHALIQPTEAGGDARWNALQSWIARNPRWQPIINEILSLSPADALHAIGTQLNLNLPVVFQLFPDAAASTTPRVFLLRIAASVTSSNGGASIST